ncbi:hypothetical protein EGT74_24400 [Chitinophaga lutea]|uniref:Methyltransferase small domain-containing protein n=1 Tax=Chitinophaga lutea TaxID=2488634 RepID=A0A3N4PDM4_9BACT|nr:methyltransferase [Chitinophaga lutea]RPE05528.1 hypothetical protein EGT74_24400 [Chitinophaga lutea]
MKLSKQQIKQHQKCVDLLNQEEMTYDEKLFVYENWYPAYDNQIGTIASFFTPVGLARDFQLMVGGKSVVDLCAGIGMLSFLYYHRMITWEETEVRVVCVERNYGFIEVGKKLFPEAEWIHGDVLDEELIKSLGRFDMAVSNPPFGNIKSDRSSKWLKYKGNDFDLKVVEIAGYLAPMAAFILPQGSLPFTLSDPGGYRNRSTEKYLKFNRETGIVLGPSMGIDCDFYKGDWKGAAPTVEVAEVESYLVDDMTVDPPEIEPVKRETSWAELLGVNREAMSDKERRARWEEWKAMARKAGDSEVVDYWAKDNIDESCAGCVHRDKDWCKLAELPCNINPVLTLQSGMIGMACMGAGKQTAPIQQTLF